MTASHGSPPLGSAARDATAAPYHGKHRASPMQACGRRISECIDDVCRSSDDCAWPSPAADAPYFPGGMSHREDRVRDQNGDHQ